SPEQTRKDRIPGPTIARLPIYFRCLAELKDQNVRIVSSGDIAAAAGIKASQFRKDLSYFGEFGIQGLGYPVEDLLNRISHIMQLDRRRRVVLLGAGNLGSALGNFPGFSKWGFDVVRIFDSSPSKIGTELNGIPIEDIDLLPQVLDVELAIVAVPPEAAQTCTELLVQSGIKAILNFTGRPLSPPGGVVVRNVNLTHELAILAYDLAGEPDLTL
ncbi:MAG: redox-sensing transcriptional repressor Rex, partial [Candidatus Eremiobacteraeota bacterium]|nr:redox-sensing transcriptional repressor Rex [Candidatus Eremiobacteraeota bacterium]